MSLAFFWRYRMLESQLISNGGIVDAVRPRTLACAESLAWDVLELHQIWCRRRSLARFLLDKRRMRLVHNRPDSLVGELTVKMMALYSFAKETFGVLLERDPLELGQNFTVDWRALSGENGIMFVLFHGPTSTEIKLVDDRVSL